MRYWQITFQVGYVSMIGGICALLRALLVNATRPVPRGEIEVRPRVDRHTISQNPLAYEDQQSPESSEVTVREEDGDDRPRARWWFRRICGHLALLSWVPLTIGIVGGLGYKAAAGGKGGNTVQSLRYVEFLPWQRDGLILRIRWRG